MPSRRTRADDRGSAELAIATPLLLLLVMLVVQTVLWAHAGHVAQTITHHTLAATRTVDATEADGRATAEQVADQLAGDLLTDVRVDVERTDITARVTVQAQVPSLLPGLTWPIRHQQEAPVERYVPATGGAP
ncbi:Flp pilus assembly protein TadG [Spinactinospora alkalitolerans]|uniref:Flp pilus assembly protein TadG n=1 Tax=Spinactinospora alkalitolerans TaxID=687207 RepID=A0A852U3H6_9ACTN|nr:TadE/TadG family type IV pilus assembly protein [Spinactinospora alkalitolerans]NYE50022.1 Flp pilus assembly protein TadG [Spinactinospora alkalitolerans]